jgi:MYXO-CTERM domain-containing protein
MAERQSTPELPNWKSGGRSEKLRQMSSQDGSEAKPTAVMVGPLALAGVVLAVRAIRRRSHASAISAVGLFGLEVGFRPYRRLMTRGALRYSNPEPGSRKTRNPDTERPDAQGSQAGDVVA